MLKSLFKNRIVEENKNRLQELGLRTADVISYDFYGPIHPVRQDIIYYRCVILCLLAVYSEAPQEELGQVLYRENLQSYFLPEEKEFLFNTNPIHEEIAFYRWGYEASYVLAWIVGVVDKLHFPDTIIDVPMFSGVIHDLLGQKILLKWRNVKEVRKQADLNLRLLWNARQLKHIENKELPDILEIEILSQRQKAFNWALGYYKTWDTTDIPT